MITKQQEKLNKPRVGYFQIKMPLSQEFKKLKASLFSEYLGKPVPSEYQKDYGKRYDKKDVEVFAIKLANKLRIKRDK